MTESVLLTPFVLVGFGVALFLCLFERSRPVPGAVLPLLSAAVAVATLIYAFLHGASLQEVLLVLLIFFAIHLSAFAGRGDDGGPNDGSSDDGGRKGGGGRG